LIIRTGRACGGKGVDEALQRFFELLVVQLCE
jgi:hypothetical protein